MGELIKIREVSLKYDISARALKYYEDMGLIKSSKSDDYAYRLYDENELKRLEQILILRKLNIKIKDIQKIFSANSSEVILEVLNQRITDIDDETALLHELKGIILDFIKQIEKTNFQRENDINLLYEKAKDIKQIISVNYDGNAANVNRLISIADKLEKAPDIRIVELPKCRMATSGTGEKSTLRRFDKMWMKLDLKRKDKFFARDFMWYDKNTNNCIWWYAVEDWVTESDTNGFKIIDFEGGIYAAAISKQEDFNDGMRVYNGINEWINSSESFDLDEHAERPHLWHVVGSPTSDSALGYRQIEIFVPMKLITK